MKWSASGTGHDPVADRELALERFLRGIVLDAEQPPEVHARLVDVIVVILDEAGALAHHALAEGVQQLGVALVVGDGEQPRALVVPGQRLVVMAGSRSAHGGGQGGEGGLGQEPLVVASGARARLVVGGDMVAGLAVVEPAGPSIDAQGNQHGIVSEVHSRGLRIRRCLLGPGGGPADEGRRVLQGRVAAHARADEELADLAPEPRRIGDDGAEIDVVGEAVETNHRARSARSRCRERRRSLDRR